MAAPLDSPEQAFRLRKFAGTNTDIDSTFLGPSLLSRSENWIPAQSYRLGKRPGTLFAAKIANGVVDVTDLLCATAPTGESLLYVYARRAADSAVLKMANDSGGFSVTTTFASATAFGRFARFRDRIYAGNGVDPMKSWNITAGTATVEAYDPIGTLDITGATAISIDIAAGDDTSKAMPTGSYEWAWGVYDTVTRRYISRSWTVAPPYVPIKIVMGTDPAVNKSGQILKVTAPTATLPANQVYRFFMAYRGFPIEYATAQGANWTPGEMRSFSSIEVSDFRIPYHAGSGLNRTGNMLLVWRNRVVFAGQASDPYSIFATDTILPGLEQDVYNQGTFFPVNAKVKLPDKVTGIAVAGVTTDQEAHAPLVFFTPTKTFLCMGDPFSTVEEAALVEVSSRVGCVGHDSIVNTPHGLIFVGLDSIYMIPPGGGYPEDIGWPIADQIRGIPPAQRATIVGQFHKQFYKLCVPQAGGTGNKVQWWLDLRQSVGSPPSWWGPHKGTCATAVAADLEHPLEIDRGYAAYMADYLVLTHQLSRFSDYDPTQTPPVNVGITSILRSGRFDAEMPFTTKVFTRIRLIAETNARSDIQVHIKTDGGTAWPIPPIELGREMVHSGEFVHLHSLTPPIPTYNAWNHGLAGTLGYTRGNAQFGSVAPVEVQTITPAIRPRGLSAVLTLTHKPAPDNLTFAAKVELRDLELLCMISGRKVRYVGESTGR